MMKTIEDNMTKQEAEQLINELSGKLNIVPPSLNWTHTARGRYFTNGMQIRVGPNCWRGTIQAILHEMAHHVCWVNLKFLGHGLLFTSVLQKVVQASGLDYDWSLEYKSVASAAGVAPATLEKRIETECFNSLCRFLSKEQALALMKGQENVPQGSN